MKLIFSLLLLSTVAQAQAQQGGYLSAQDQKYYKNDSFEGNNQRERIDSLVKEMNKLHGDIAGMKAEIQILKAEVQEMKKGK
jgi:peptidoglycan hydrolase CwlO-like protein